MDINHSIYFNRLKNLLPIFFSLFSLMFLFPALFFYPNDFLFNEGQDAQRAYFTFMMYMRNQHAWFEFPYLNYPFGENIFYLDVNPLLLFVLRPLFYVFPFLIDYGIGIFNFIHLFQLIICIIYLDIILKKIGLNIYYSIVGSLLITFYSPQLLKIAGNFSLSWLFIFPAAIYYILCWVEKYKFSYAIGLIVLAIISFFIHPYLGIILTSFAVITLLLYLLLNKNMGWKNGFILFLISIIPLLLYMVTVKVTDIHLNRTTSPGGYMDNYLGIYEWLVQPNGLTGKIFTAILNKDQTNYFDAAYIPAIFHFFLLIGIYLLLKYKYSLNKSHVFLLFSFIGSSLLLMVFATGCFGFSNLEWIYEWISYARQLRLVSRFAWPFYYVYALVSLGLFLYGIQSIIRLNQKLKLIIPSILLIYAFVDLFIIQKELNEKLKSTPNYYHSVISEKDAHLVNQLNSSEKWACIMPLPLALEGSFRYASPFNENSIKNAYRIAWILNQPILGGILIRPSENEMEIIRESVNIPIYKRPIIDYIADKNARILMIAERNNWSVVEAAMINLSENTGYNFSNSGVYSMSVQQWSEVNCSAIVNNSLDTNYILNEFENQTGTVAHSGKGSIRYKRGDFNVIKKIFPNQLNAGIYKASCWVYNRNENSVNGCFLVHSLDVNGNSSGWISFSNPARSEIIHQGWSYVEVEFEIKKNTTYEIAITAYDFKNLYFIVDDLFIREANSHRLTQNPLQYDTHLPACRD
jgi:hypothetical protein